jgi:hypothetical protein
MAATQTSERKDDLRLIGRRLCELRRVAGCTQWDIQRESGINFTRIGAAERGQVRLKPDEYELLHKALMKLTYERLSEILDSFTEAVGA